MTPNIDRRGKSAVILAAALVAHWVVPALTAPALAKRPNIVNKDGFYTEIGTYDENLSRLCSKMLFNQQSQLRFSAYFSKDRVLLGGATGTGWNLKDPTGARRFDRDYWFRSDGFSTCEVYYSLNPKRPSAGAPGKAGTTSR